jgi:hypothetical protein
MWGYYYRNERKSMYKLFITAYMIICSVVLVGCAGSPDRSTIAGRGEIRDVGVKFSDAVRNKDIDSALMVLDPYMGGGQLADLKRRLKVAMRLRLYRDYKPNWDEAVRKISDRDLEDGRVTITVTAENSDGFEFLDRYGFVDRRDGWFISGLRLQKPLKGEELDLPEDEEKEIRRVLREVFKHLKEGKAGWFMSNSKGDKGNLYRYGKRSFWGGITGAEPARYSIYEDFARLEEFNIAKWPDIGEKLPLAYLGFSGLVACYDVPYSWPAGGIYDGILRIEIFFSLRGGEWVYEMIRFHGEGIPE